ncbi:sensor domain-containing diguanylate cyclase/phosphohydrolase [Neorhodopirellula pilleata]|uniref:sensor domain-containing diguanylate cyclase/phosphohydrolase n=1 Tax=Neorhodopirellula pilleata TaxID=2714738 RepID=UPI0011B7D256|nr:diguanylate cyclase [Neorhodopirellula pilleata]
MFKAIFASFRLAFALVCVGLGLILGAQWFGLIPDSRVQIERARQSTCQNIAIGVLDDIRHERWLKIDGMLQAIVKRDEHLLSVGLRTDLGQLRVATENHEQCWQTIDHESKLVDDPVDDVPEWARPSASPNHRDRRTTTWVTPPEASDGARGDASITSATSLDRHVCLEVPIIVRDLPWGNLEFCFRDTSSGLFGNSLDAGITGFILFFSVCGLGSYTLLMMRIMGVFSRTQVVPDRVRQALDTLAEGLLVLDGDGKIVLANENFLQINGFESDELIDRLAADLPWFFPSTDPRKADARDAFPWTRAIKQRQSVTAEILRMTGRDGVHRVFSVNAGPIGDDSQQKGALVTFQDVTHVEKHRVELENMLTMLRRSKDEIQKKNQELEILATRDALTGCLNRRAFFERMQPLLEQYRKDARPVSCFMVDVDHFKSVNDTYGHHTGDEVLRAVSKQLREIFEERHIVCRYGGEEFCVVLPGLDLDEAHEEAERTRLAIMNIRLEDPAELRLTASIGVSETRFGATETQDLINQADECLYVAKRGGRNQSVLFDPDRVSVLGEEEPKTESIADPDLVKLPFNAVNALVSALAYRDPTTAEHSRRVANMCVKAAKGLLCQRDTYVLEIAALLHDIGKIGIPDTVLHKPGPLDENEWKIMRRHNSVGIDMIAGTFHCAELENIIRTHHSMSAERQSSRKFDFESTPIASRLLNIADAYDSMISDQAYRRGCSPEEAIDELRRNSGTQFDPELVEVFIRETITDRRESRMGFATSRGIAFVVSRPVAFQIGQQIEQLADAIDKQDIETLKRLATELNHIAEANFLMPMVECTSRITTAADASDEEIQWVELLKETQTLLDLCRSTQNAHLAENPQSFA